MFKSRSFIFELNETAVMQLMLLLRQLSVIILAIFFSRNYSISEIGQVEGLQYLLAAFSVFWLNGILQWFLPAYHREEEKKRGALMWRVAVLLFFLSFMLFIVVNQFRPAVFRFFLHREPFQFLDLFLLYAFMMLPSYFLEYVLFVKEKYREIVFVSVFTLFILNLPVFFGVDLDDVFKIWAISAGLRFVYLLIELLPFTSNNLQDYRRTLLLSAPLIVYALISQWAATYNSWLVNYLYGGDAFRFAIFRYGARELPLSLSLATGLSATMSAAISRNFFDGVQLLKSRSERLMHQLFPFTVLLLICSNYWFPMVFSKSLTAAVPVFDVFLLLIISRMFFPQSVALALGANKMLMWVSLLELLVNMLASYFLARDYGLIGIAGGTLIAYIFEKAMIAALLQWRYSVRFSSYTSWRWYFLYSGLSLLAFGLKYAFLQTLFVQ